VAYSQSTESSLIIQKYSQKFCMIYKPQVNNVIKDSDLSSKMILQINKDRCCAEIETLASISSCEGPAVTRILYSTEDQRSRQWLKGLMNEIGLTISEDGLGNLTGRWTGSDENLSPVATGSHTDAIPFSGKYDGVIGVLGAIEAIRSLQEAGFKPRRSIDVIQFTAEEPTLFGIGCLGSRAMSGSMTVSEMSALRSDQEDDIDKLRKAAGYHLPLSDVLLDSSYYHGFIELHIEQGPRLERDKLDIGIVTAIAAPATLKFELKGDGGHAGAVLMPGRKDALVAATYIIQEIEKAANNSESPDSVATVGIMDIHPSAINSIPSHVEFYADIRDINLDSRNQMVQYIKDRASQVCKDRNIQLKVSTVNADDPCLSDPALLDTIEAACVEASVSFKRLVSRAYHDTLFMSRICPTAMIFIPSESGYSHRPEEYSSPEEIEKGILILAKTLAIMSHDI